MPRSFHLFLLLGLIGCPSKDKAADPTSDIVPDATAASVGDVIAPVDVPASDVATAPATDATAPADTTPAPTADAIVVPASEE